MIRVVFAEGGAKGNSRLNGALREAMGQLLEQAGIRQRPRVIFCGGCQDAFERFSDEPVENGPALLVDSEGPLTGTGVKLFLQTRAENALALGQDVADDRLFCMVQCMETWFLIERSAVAKALKFEPPKKTPSQWEATPVASVQSLLNKTRLRKREAYEQNLEPNQRSEAYGSAERQSLSCSARRQVKNLALRRVIPRPRANK